ncbi:hypothetical protein HPP92_025946 [Vanilla planifolia]|uniref:Uncharacterized protein n=1 Tax=Vanilla planifolia TaxID=51239 RepID=A0A835PGE4_VANPL|nr:hypothetical protein HPP92_025946 [Vanilla planifolia]
MWSRSTKGNCMDSLSTKFRRCLVALRRWSRREMRDIVGTNTEYERRIGELQDKEAGQGLNKEENTQLGNLISEFHRGCVFEKWWCQREKIHWVQLGDKNTRFFHAAATTRWLNNNISQMKNDEGNTMESRADISNILLQFFGSKWRGGPWVAPSIRHLSHNCISLENREWLTREITEEEVANAIRTSRRNKAPGMDGITTEFVTGY